MTSDNSTGVLKFGPYSVTGTYYLNGDSDDNNFDFASSSADVDGTTEEVIGGLTPPVVASGTGNSLSFDSGAENWTPASESDFVSTVEAMNDVSQQCNS